MSSLLESALFYASIGWKIFPLAPGQKTPITAHGVKDATGDIEQIKKWWNDTPTANIGLACGKESGVYVVDVDVSASGDVNGYDSLKEFPELPKTVKQDTPRGGFHAFYETSDAPANRNSYRPGIDIRGDGYYVVLAPSLHPNGGRYCWSPNLAPGQHIIEEYPAYMRPVKRVPWVSDGPALQKPQSAPHSSFNSSSGLLDRAKKYLATCEPAVQGNAGHDKLLWAATSMVRGFKLPESVAYDLLTREYNPICVPPWNLSDAKDEKDFRRKISEASRLPLQKQDGWLLIDSGYSDAPLVPMNIQKLIEKDIDAIKQTIGMTNAIIGVPPKLLDTLHNSQDSGIFAKHAELRYLTQPTGMLGEICSWLNATARREQPALSLGAAIAFMGALFGQKIKTEYGSRTNIYCMGVAKSSAGKNHAISEIRRLCLAAGCDSLLGGDGVTSDSSIEERLSNNPVTLFMWDEIGHFFSNIKGGNEYMAQVVPMLMKIYSSSGTMYKGKEYAEKERQRTIIHPCCCIYGTSTPERFAGGILPGELTDGWLGRCLVFYSDEFPEKRCVVEQPVPQSLINRIRFWYERRIEPANDGHTLTGLVTASCRPGEPNYYVVKTLPEADKIFNEFDEETIEYAKEQKALASVWTKGEENARKIGLIVAAGESESEFVISKGHAEYACRLIRYLINDFCYTIVPEIAGSAIENNKRRVISVIRESSIKGLVKMDLSKSTRWCDKRTRDNIIADLVEAGEIIERKWPGSGVTRYWTAENYSRAGKIE